MRLGENAQTAVTAARWRAMSPQQQAALLASKKEGFDICGMSGLGIFPATAYGAARAAAGGAASATVTGIVSEWLNPFADGTSGPSIGPIKNVKAAVVVAVGGYLLWKFLRRK